MTHYNPYSELKKLQSSELLKCFQGESNLISIGTSLYKVILRLSKARHGGSTHMPPWIHTKATLKTTSLLAYSPRENKHSVKRNKVEDHPTTHKEFPFGIPT